MTSPDQLHALLDRSAPPAVTITDAVARDLDSATAMARAHVTSERQRPRRAPRFAAAFGLAALLTGGAGAAVAAGGFDWLPWAQDPDVSYPFALPSGRECGIRLVLEEIEPEGNWDAFLSDVESMTIDPANVARWVKTIEDDPTATLTTVGTDGQFSEGILASDATEDDVHAAATYAAVTDSLLQASVDAGVATWWSSNAQMQCEPVAP